MPFLTDDATACPHYITFSTQHRLHLFNYAPLCDLFVDQLRRTHQREFFHLFAYVVMPHHVHLLLQPHVPVERILTAIKRPVSFRALRFLEHHDSALYAQLQIQVGRRANHRFWLQGGGRDHWLTEEEDLIEVATYIHNNPVRWGLVKRPEDWQWSSARYWLLGDRWFPMDTIE